MISNFSLRIYDNRIDLNNRILSFNKADLTLELYSRANLDWFFKLNIVNEKHIAWISFVMFKSHKPSGFGHVPHKKASENLPVYILFLHMHKHSRFNLSLTDSWKILKIRWIRKEIMQNLTFLHARRILNKRSFLILLHSDYSATSQFLSHFASKYILFPLEWESWDWVCLRIVITVSCYKQ